MERRSFLKKSLALGATMSTPFYYQSLAEVKKEKLLSAYYFRAHMYTMVPRHVRDDLMWMADVGTDNVCIALLEQDLFSAVENIAIICEEASRLNMKVFAVPSRWGGMVAGAPKVPSLFSVKNPHTWVLKEDGTPELTRNSGVISSVHYTETFEFFCNTLKKMFSLWDIAGVIWDEPKSFIKDYSPEAVKKVGDAPLEEHVKAVVEFYSRVNSFIKEISPKTVTNLFTYAFQEDMILDLVATTHHLDYFGCDGRPWYEHDNIEKDERNKVLLGNGERFLKAARKYNKGSLWLIENHNLPTAYIPVMEKRLPEVISKDIDHLLYYYYPRNIEEPDRNMEVFSKYLKTFK